MCVVGDGTILFVAKTGTDTQYSSLLLVEFQDGDFAQPINERVLYTLPDDTNFFVGTCNYGRSAFFTSNKSTNDERLFYDHTTGHSQAVFENYSLRVQNTAMDISPGVAAVRVFFDVPEENAIFTPTMTTNQFTQIPGSTELQLSNRDLLVHEIFFIEEIGNESFFLFSMN
jgi:hypothetical protein